jgi:mono/diheme cytochrome c family protein
MVGGVMQWLARRAMKPLPMRETSFFPRSALLVSLALTACPAGDDDAAADSTTGAASTSAASGDASGDASGTIGEVTAADSTAGDEPTTTADSTSGAEASGEELFRQICAPCHGPEGEGTELAYALQHPVRDYSTWVVRNGRPGIEFPGTVMAAYGPGTASDATLEEVWDYLDSFPQPTTGEGLFLDYCRNCHGEDASGGVTGVDLREADALAEIFEQVREGDGDGNFAARDEFMPAFDTTRLSDAEVQLIADHIASL